MKARSLPAYATALAILLASCLTSGCVTRSYKLADKSSAPAVALNLESTPAPAEAAVRTVIVYHGPGSWKREAYWDEYVVTLTNSTDKPLVFAAANLVDGKGEGIAAGDNPWAIEKLSKKWWENNALRQTGTYFALGAGTIAGFGAAWTASWASFGAAMSGTSVASGTAAAGAIGTATFFALPVVAGGTVYMNVRRKHQVEAEFKRRRLVLPITLNPGETREGSLFFRITPAPQQLKLDCRSDDATRDVVIDLAPLHSLHIQAPAQIASVTPATPAAP